MRQQCAGKKDTHPPLPGNFQLAPGGAGSQDSLLGANQIQGCFERRPWA
jgi:hypothetical protein